MQLQDKIILIFLFFMCISMLTYIVIGDFIILLFSRFLLLRVYLLNSFFSQATFSPIASLFGCCSELDRLTLSRSMHVREMKKYTSSSRHALIGVCFVSSDDTSLQTPRAWIRDLLTVIIRNYTRGINFVKSGNEVSSVSFSN